MSAQVTAAPLAGASAKANARARVEVLVPLVGAYLFLATVYAWQAWRRETPTIFTDELETTQISRAISETGQAARRGEAYGFSSLVPWLTAPFWWLHPVASAYESIKTVQAFVMAGAIFPAYLLARRVVSPGWAYFAAVAAIAAPALSYSPILVEEPWAYPAATLALWLMVRAVDEPARRSLLLALGACILAVLVRSQLAALLGALAFGLLALGLALRDDEPLAGIVVALGLGRRRRARHRDGHRRRSPSSATGRTSGRSRRRRGRGGWSSTGAGPAARSRSASACCPRSRCWPCSPFPPPSGPGRAFARS